MKKKTFFVILVVLVTSMNLIAQNQQIILGLGYSKSDIYKFYENTNLKEVDAKFDLLLLQLLIDDIDILYILDKRYDFVKSSTFKTSDKVFIKESLTDLNKNYIMTKENHWIKHYNEADIKVESYKHPNGNTVFVYELIPSK